MITDDEVANLPQGMAGFLAFEAICRARYNSEIRSSGDDDALDLRISYLSNVLSAAEYFGVEKLKDIHLDTGDDFDFSTARTVARFIDTEITRLRFTALREQRPTAIIEEPQRLKIEHLIGQLRQRVAESDLEDRKKARLSKKLDELSALFSAGQRPSLQATMIVIASVFTAINLAEAAIIKLPDVISAVLEVFGHAEEDAQDRLLEHKKQRLIEDHNRAKGDAYTPPIAASDLNDDIPF